MPSPWYTQFWQLSDAPEGRILLTARARGQNLLGKDLALPLVVSRAELLNQSVKDVGWKTDKRCVPKTGGASLKTFIYSL